MVIMKVYNTLPFELHLMSKQAVCYKLWAYNILREAIDEKPSFTMATIPYILLSMVVVWVN